jgi:hypothetical protein
MPKKTVDGMTPEEFFVKGSRQAQANECDSSEWEYRIALMNDFGFTDGWAYEVMKKLIKKYVDLGQLTVKKIWYKTGDGKIWHDRQLFWKEELLPPPDDSWKGEQKS